MLQFTKETKKAKMGNYAQTSKISYENSWYQKQEKLMLKHSATKLVCILYGGKIVQYL